VVDRAHTAAETPIPCDFPPEDVDADTAPDDILIEMLLCNQVLLTRTDRPTVQYLHCGMSNRQNWRGVSGYE
jgi:hypothetical protein